MTRLGILLNATTGVAVIAALGAATSVECNAAWRQHQARYIALAGQKSGEGSSGQVDESIRPHELVASETGAVERCTSCHLGMEPGSPTFDEAPFRGHPGDLLDVHPIARFGCTSCHGGQGRALDQRTAHDGRPGGGWSAFTPPAVRCGRCHAAAGLADTGLLERGVAVYLREACYGCHRPGRNGPGIGPDLASIGLRGTDYLRRVVLYPDQVYPRTVMPPTRFRIGEEGDDVDALVAFLKTLEPWPRSAPRVEAELDPRSCVGCHWADRPEAKPRGVAHRCTYLHSESTWLDCTACHAARPAAASVVAPPAAPNPDSGLDQMLSEQREKDAVPAPVGDPNGACPHLVEAFSVCGVCHRSEEPRR